MCGHNSRIKQSDLDSTMAAANALEAENEELRARLEKYEMGLIAVGGKFLGSYTKRGEKTSAALAWEGEPFLHAYGRMSSSVRFAREQNRLDKQRISELEFELKQVKELAANLLGASGKIETLDQLAIELEHIGKRISESDDTLLLFYRRLIWTTSVEAKQGRQPRELSFYQGAGIGWTEIRPASRA